MITNSVINSTAFSQSYNVYAPTREIWGAGTTMFGELDNQFNTRKFVQFDTGTNWETFGANANTLVAIKTDGTLWSWGNNLSGQIGLNDTVGRSSPVQIGTLTWVSASTQTNTSFAIRSDSTLWGWGSNIAGELGLGDTISRSSPVQLGTHTWKNILPHGLGHTIAQRSDDTFWGWGDTRNAVGVYGNGERPGAFGQIDGGSLDWSDVSIGNSYTIAIGSDGRMWVWGFNTNGQLGLNDTVNRSSPVQVGTLNTWVSASAGRNNNVMAIQNNGTLWAWGVNTNGQLGLGDLITRSSPVQVGTLNNWMSVNSVGGATIAIKTDGTIWSWGGGSGIGAYSAQLASNNFELRQIDNLTTWTSASYNGHQVIALKTDGTLWSWGTNSSGQLGLNDTVTRSSPVQVGTLNNWSKISLSQNTAFCLAIKSDGTLWSWGSNGAGGLGQGITTSINRSSPVQVGTRTWNEICGGRNAAMAIRSDGTLWSWGANNFGLLGTDNSTSYSSPVQVGTETNWSKISLGAFYSAVGIKTDGSIWTWGDNSYGQLGLNLPTNIGSRRSNPVLLDSLNVWSDARQSGLGMLAIKNDGTLWSWGDNSVGQLGVGDLISRSSPVQVGVETDWLKIQSNEALEDWHGQFAIKTDGSLWGWGSNILKDNIYTGTSAGSTYSTPVQIGEGISWSSMSQPGRDYPGFAITSDNKLYAGPGTIPNVTIWGNTARSSPVQIGTDTNWLKIHSNGGGNAISVIKTDGSLWGWGSAVSGFPVIGKSYGTIDSPVQVGADYWQSFANGSSFVVGIKTDGTLWSWGQNSFGELGLNDRTTRSSPVQVGTLLWNTVNATGNNVLAIDSNNSLWGWGRNNAYQLGLNNITSFSSPVQISGETNFSKVFLGDSHSGVIKTRLTNELWTSGVANTYTATYRVINGWDGFRRSPILLSESGVWNKISVGQTHTLGIKTNGTLWAWGVNTNGELGIGDIISRSSPVQIGTRTDWSNVFPFTSYTMAITNNKNLWAWGNNSSGQLGLNLATTAHRSSPVQVGTRLWNTIGTNGSSTTFGIRNDGTLWAWGNNGNGNYGIGETISRSSPVQIGTENDWLSFGLQPTYNSSFFAIKNNKSMYVANFPIANPYSGFIFQKSSPIMVTSTSNWKSVNAGTSFTIAISASGSIWAWGNATTGVIGNNVIVAGEVKESPVQIGTLTNWASASCGETNVAAIKTDNSIWTWGVNTAGQLGLNDSVSRSSPVQVGTLTNWLKVSTGRSHVMAIKTDGTLWGWGINNSGQIGDNTSTNRSSPVQLGTFTNWSKVSGGDGHTVAINTAGELYVTGLGNTGQLGRGNTSNISAFQKVGVDAWTDISAGNQMTVAIRSDGTLWSWGNNSVGQLGILRNRSLPNYVIRPTIFTDAKAGNDAVLAISPSGSLWGWGANSSGQLGLNDAVYRSSPVQIGTTTWNKFSAGHNQSLAIVNGQLWVWGGNVNSELGLRVDGPQYISGSNVWNNTKAGDFGHIILRKNDNTLWSIGANTNGALGIGNTNRQNSPVQIGTRTWNSYSVGASHTLAIRSDGTLWGWGQNTGAELGLLKSRSNPQYVNITQTWQNAKTGNQGNVIVHSTDGSLWGWGTNSSGQLGLNDIVNRSSPVQIGTETNWQTYHVGDGHVIAVKTDGTLWSWGQDGGGGALGLNETINRSSAVQVGTLTNWSKVSAGAFSSYSIKTDGTLWAWGTNGTGQIGDNTQVSRSSPVQIGTRNDWKQLAKSSAGVSHMMAISNDNTLWYWGSGTNGKLGNNLSTNRSSPVQLGTETNWAVVSLSIDNTYAIKTDGTLWSWGLNNLGQLGLNLATTAHRSSPVQVGTLNTWLDVSAGYSFTMAIRNDGTLWSWGVNTNGQLGDGTLINRSSPVQIGTLNTWVSASGGNGNAVLLQNSGYALTTGNSFHPGWDIDFVLNRSSPVQIGFDTDWSYVSAGYHSFGIKNNGTLWSWGPNSNGRLGLGNTTNQSSPVQVGTLSNWSKAYANGRHGYAIKTDGTLWSWGWNIGGELGLNDSGTDRSSPVQVGTLTWSSVAETSSDGTHVMAIRTDGTLWSWGQNTITGRLGLGDTFNRSSPVQVGTRADWILSAINDGSSMAIRADGTLWSWGSNTQAELGLNDIIFRSSPVQVGTLSTWVSASFSQTYSTLLENNGYLYTTGLSTSDFSRFVSNRSSPVQLGTLSNWADADGGYLASFAVKTDGTLWAWGRNNEGQLGLNDTVTRSSPVQIGTLNNWAKVVGGASNTYAIKTDGTIWSWGFGSTYGQLGLGNTISRSSPVQIGTRTWSSLASGVNGLPTHMLAIRSDGTLWAWGSNDFGELGLSLNSLAYRSSPVQVGTETNWVSTTVGTGTSMAIRSDGTLWAWGTNATARLGLGDTVSRSSPVQVGTLSNWVSASLGSANSVLLQNNGYALTTGNTAPGYDVDSYSNRSTPAQIGVDNDWQKVKAGHTGFSGGGNQVLAQKTDGTLWTWGPNTFGNLGDGSLITRSSPVQIGNETNWVDFDAEYHFVGIKSY